MKPIWIIFPVVALVVISCSASDTPERTNEPLGTGKPESADRLGETHSNQAVIQAPPSFEADRVYKKAVTLLSTIRDSPPTQKVQPTTPASSGIFSKVLSSILPSPHGQGPFSSAVRIAMKLRHQSWLPRIVWTLLGLDSDDHKEDMKTSEGYRNTAAVISLLKHAISLGHTDAMFTLASLSLFPPTSSYPSDPKLAFEALNTHASLTGNATAQSLLGFFYATGYHDVTKVDQAKAQLYYTFAAAGGHRGAQMALGYRYWTGIGVREDCTKAVEWYERAARQAMNTFKSGPPGGKTIPPTATKLSDLVGGVYGPGASVASTGLNSQRPVVKAASSHAAGDTWEDVLEYYLFNADRGETDFAYRLGKIYYQGSLYQSPGGIASGSEGVGLIHRDYEQAMRYFLYIAKQVWPTDPPDLRHVPFPSREEAGHVGFAAASAAYIGRMFLRGEGVKTDYRMAKLWFERGAEFGDRECHNGLGIIYRDGLITGKGDIQKALGHFTVAAGQELAEAQVNLGKHHYERGEMKLAITHFENAIRNGSPFEAYYYLAQFQARTMRATGYPRHITSSACSVAVSFYKVVAERGVWDADLISHANLAWTSGNDRNKEIAMLQWWIAAERGYEPAQNNLAYVLDQDKSVLKFTRFSPMSPSNDTARVALTQWTRSASQNNIDALVKVGDYYYHGFGVPDEPEAIRWEKAAGYYQSAADTQFSALAMWNLGWMYENGIGVTQDFHLAKRHYDLALATNTEAYFPVTLSLIKLRIRKFWHTTILRDHKHDSPPDVAENPGIEGKRPEDAYAGSPSEEYSDEYDNGWFVGKGQHKGKDSQV
ncbi:HCP-like protein, partial [Thelephora ganbajun]